jgi:hypothetical protein
LSRRTPQITHRRASLSQREATGGNARRQLRRPKDPPNQLAPLVGGRATVGDGGTPDTQSLSNKNEQCGNQTVRIFQIRPRDPGIVGVMGAVAPGRLGANPWGLAVSADNAGKSRSRQVEYAPAVEKVVKMIRRCPEAPEVRSAPPIGPGGQQGAPPRPLPRRPGRSSSTPRASRSRTPPGRRSPTSISRTSPAGGKR